MGLLLAKCLRVVCRGININVICLGKISGLKYNIMLSTCML